MTKYLYSGKIFVLVSDGISNTYLEIAALCLVKFHLEN